VLAVLDSFTPDVVSDHRMAGMTGVELRVVAARRRGGCRLGYVDIEVGDGVTYVAKPYVAAELLAACR
jgi:hypothetical protein